ncbi:hypothetical protein [Hyalangium versicolor]|uniref:hypothetical protein n=1 Tax=Hyalangium versicolor TaxID=2861190 RepID=UPI001CCEE196|nr:hypothetical protein [Hyalangium versicolor]
MRSRFQLSRLSPLLSLLALTGCNTAYREAMSRAEDAAIRGDFMAAAHAYRSACAASPDDEKACSRAPIFAQKATDQAIVTARPACDAGDLDQCLPPLLAARELIPDHPEVNSMLAKGSQVHIEYCSKWKADGSLTTASAGLACLQSRSAQLPVPSFQSLVADRANQLSSRFGQLAATAQGPGSAGAASVLLSAAQCLAPSSDAGSRADQARQGFLSQSAIPVGVRVDGKMPPSIADQLTRMCQSVAGNLAPAARCAEGGIAPGQPDPLEIRVSALIQRTVERITEDVRSLRYVSGTRQVHNPEFRAARERLDIAEHNLRDVEAARRDREQACEQSKRSHEASCAGCTDKKSPCDEARELSDRRDARLRERDDARQYLGSIPETLTEEVYDDFRYSVLTHRWSSPYRFSLQSSSPGSAPTPEQAGELSFEDQEHVGFSPGGLMPDPLEVPPTVAYADLFIRQVAPSVFTAVQKESVARGSARRAQCSALPEDWGVSWVQCWAEASLWERGQEPQVTEFLSLLASSGGASAQPQCR